MTTRMLRWGSLALALALLAGCATGRSVRKAQAAGRHGDWDTAVAYYREALRSDPGNIEVKVSLQRAMRLAADGHVKRARELEAQDQLSGAAAEYRQAADLDPSYTLAYTKSMEMERKIRDQIEASRPRPSIDVLREQAAQTSTIPRLDPRTKIPLLKFPQQTAIRDILGAIGDFTGINITYDQQAQAAVNQGFSITLQDATLESALDQVLTANGLTFKVTNPKTIFVYQDNAPNRQKYEDQYFQVFYLSHVDAQEMNTLINQILATGPQIRPAIQVNKTANALTVKATAPVLSVIDGIIKANDKPRAEVMIDVEILEVDRTRSRQLGLDLNQWALGFTFSPELSPRNVTPAVPGFPEQPPPFNLNTLSHGVSAADFYPTAPTALIRLLETDVNTKLLARPQLRGREGTALTLNLGDDVPVPQTTFQSSAAGGIANVPTTAFQYRSVGVNLSITPRVTYQDEIILDPLNIEKSSVGQNVIVAGQSLPSFSKRSANVSMRLRDGESNILAGLIKEEDRRTLTSLPGLSSIPILRSLFGNSDKSSETSDVVMIVTPHIVRSHELTADDLKPIYIGTQQNFGGGGVPQLISVDAPPPPATMTTPPPAGTAPPPVPTTTGGAGQPPPPTTPTAPPAAPPRAPGVVPVVPVTAAPETAPARIAVTAPGSELQAGGPPYTVPITITGVKNLGSVTLSLSYNPAVLRAVTVTQGTFMQKGGVTPTFAPRIDAANGRIDIAITRTGDAGASDDGLLAGIVFQAVAAGQSAISISGVAMTPTGQPITILLTSATVVVR